ncbi:hypothetical protein [Blastococcus montanus]|uniref:hypothetical protein n=1 Tax=Blastococcus montanus TaxID=3144973 RepID=UPI00320B4DE0
MTLSRAADTWGLAAIGSLCVLLALCGIGAFHVLIISAPQVCVERNLRYDDDPLVHTGPTSFPFSNRCNSDPESELVPDYVNPGIALAGAATLLFLAAGAVAQLRYRRRVRQLSTDGHDDRLPLGADEDWDRP